MLLKNYYVHVQHYLCRFTCKTSVSLHLVQRQKSKNKYTKYCGLVIYHCNIKTDKEQIIEMAFRVMFNY